MSVSNDPRLLSTADVRNGFAGAAASHSDMLRRAAEFDAWLADHDERVRVEAVQITSTFQASLARAKEIDGASQAQLEDLRTAARDLVRYHQDKGYLGGGR